VETLLKGNSNDYIPWNRVKTISIVPDLGNKAGVCNFNICFFLDSNEAIRRGSYSTYNLAEDALNDSFSIVNPVAQKPVVSEIKIDPETGDTLYKI
jgi:hypothetical protein